MAQNDFLDKHVQNITGARLTFDALLNKLNTDVYGKEMRTDISTSVEALGKAINEMHENNGSGVGWTDYQIDLLETILKAAAYADTGIGDEINRLIASLRRTKVLVGLQVSPDTVTANAGDTLGSIRDKITVVAIFTDGYVENNEIIDDYNLNGSLIQGKDCPISVSYTKDGFTISKTITVTVRERIPLAMTARLFGDVGVLPVGVTSKEIKDAIYAQVIYDDGYRETTSDLLVGDNTVVPYTNKWTVTSSVYSWIDTLMEFRGDAYISSSGRTKVVYLLEECSSTNTETEVPSGEIFNTVISPNHGSIESLKVFADGVDYTSLFVSDGKTVNILGAYVKEYGHIVISAKAASSCTITYHLTNCTSSNTVESVSYDGAFLTVISPNDGYELDLQNTYITMGSSKISSTDGTFSILGVTNDIDVYGVAKPASGGEVTLTSISASYTGGMVAAGTTLEQLTGITVTATYSDGSTGTVTGYTLSGNLTAGKTNTITVTYQGKTATFEVTVEASGDPGVDVIATYGRAEGYRISTSGGTNSALSGCVAVGAKNDATGIIPYKVGDVFYIKGITFPSAETNGSVIVFYSDSNGSHQSNAAQVIYNYENTTFPATFSYNSSTGVLTVRINNVMIANSISHPYLRFSLLCSDVSQLKVMKNEVI